MSVLMSGVGVCVCVCVCVCTLQPLTASCISLIYKMYSIKHKYQVPVTRADALSRGRDLASAGSQRCAGNHRGMPCTLGQSRLNQKDNKSSDCLHCLVQRMSATPHTSRPSSSPIRPTSSLWVSSPACVAAWHTLPTPLALMQMSAKPS